MNTKNNQIHDGVVIKKNKSQYWVWTQGESLRCSLKSAAVSDHSKNKKKQSKSQKETIDIVAGDRVSIKHISDGSAQIIKIYPRFNQLARRAVKAKLGSSGTSEQLIAANIDQLVAVMALTRPAPSWNLLDRYLVTAESLEVETLICLTKLDLPDEENSELAEETLQEIENYRKLGYRVLLTSAHTGEGIDELKHAFDGKVSVLMGKSGVGKSSLLNTLLPGLDLRVSEVNAVTGKGRHTTTGTEMYACGSEGWLVDTAGTREFALWDVDSEDMAWFFPEMRPWLGQCRFGLDCRHDEEPGCALRQAVMDGQINPRRYFSMMKLKEEGYLP